MKHETHSQFTKTEGEREQRVKDEGGGCLLYHHGFRWQEIKIV